MSERLLSSPSVSKQSRRGEILTQPPDGDRVVRSSFCKIINAFGIGLQRIVRCHTYRLSYPECVIISDDLPGSYFWL